MEVPWVLAFSWYVGIAGLAALQIVSKRRLEQASKAGLQLSQREHLLRILVLCLILFLDCTLASAMTTALASVDIHLLLLLLVDNCMIAMRALHTLVNYIVFLQAGGATDGVHAGSTWQRDTAAYTDFFLDGGAELCQLLHYFHIWSLNGLSFSVIDFVLGLSVKGCLSSLKKRWVDFGAYRRLNRTLDDYFADATEEQLLVHPPAKASDGATAVSTATGTDGSDAAGAGADGLRQRNVAAGPAPSSSSSSVAAGVGSASSNSQTHGQQPVAKAVSIQPAEPREYKECSICLEPMTSAKVLPMCGHLFHKHCLRGWLFAADNAAAALGRADHTPNNQTCPLCRKGITADVIARQEETRRRELQLEREQEARAAAAMLQSERFLAARSAHAAGASHQAGRQHNEASADGAAMPVPGGQSREVRQREHLTPAIVYLPSMSEPRAPSGSDLWRDMRSFLDSQGQPAPVGAAGRPFQQLPPLQPPSVDARTEAAVQQLTEMFPELSPSALRMHYLSGGRRDINVVIDAAFAGLIEGRHPPRGDDDADAAAGAAARAQQPQAAPDDNPLIVGANMATVAPSVSGVAINASGTRAVDGHTDIAAAADGWDVDGLDGAVDGPTLSAAVAAPQPESGPLPAPPPATSNISDQPQPGLGLGSQPMVTVAAQDALVTGGAGPAVAPAASQGEAAVTAAQSPEDRRALRLRAIEARMKALQEGHQ